VKAALSFLYIYIEKGVNECDGSYARGGEREVSVVTSVKNAYLDTLIFYFSLCLKW
jgi:hypothetical protein